MNYGHPLEFGAFITPAYGSADEPVRLAQRSARSSASTW